LLADLGPVESTWLVVVRASQELDVAGARTAKSAAGLLGFGSPALGAKENVAVKAFTESVHVAELERIVRVWADVLVIWATPVLLL
jgi:hypothetical protein